MAASIASIATAQAFEVSGYRHGVSLETIQARVKVGGSFLQQDPRDPSRWLMSAGSNSKVTSAFQFCDGKLFSLSYLSGRGVGVFSAEVRKMIETFGDPAVSVQREIGQSSALKLEWQTVEGEGRYLMLGSISGEPDEIVSGYDARSLVCASPSSPAGQF